MLLNESLINEEFFPLLYKDRLTTTLIVTETINFCQIYKDNSCSLQILLY